MAKNEPRYTIDDGKIRWASRRTEELGNARIDVGLGLEKLTEALDALKDGINKMHNQPESEMVLDSAKRLTAIGEELAANFKHWEEDRKEIDKAIMIYRKGRK